MKRFRRANKTLLLGFAVGVLSILIGIAMEIRGNNPAVFIHPVGLVIVLGGGFAASCISLPMRELKRVYERTYYAVLFPKDDFLGAFREIVHVAVRMHRDPMAIQNGSVRVFNAMMRDAIALISMGYKNEDIRRFLERKREHNESAYVQCASYYFNVAKLGPAFGLLGTLIGLIIVLYYYMASGDMTRVASSMGVALTATLYGVGLSNLVFGPLAEYMQYTAETCSHIDELIVQGAILIRERRHPLHVVQALKSYVPREDYAVVDEMVKAELAAVNKAAADTKAANKGGAPGAKKVG